MAPLADTEIYEFDAEQAEELLKAPRKADHPGGELVAVRARDPLTREAAREILGILPRIIEARRQGLSEQKIATLVELLMPDDPFGNVRKQLEFDNAEQRVRLLKEVPFLTSRQIHKAAGGSGRNTSMPASRWKREGLIFGVPWHGKDRYPAFQFRDGRPVPTIAAVLKALPRDMSPWQIAFWFVAENGWLAGQRPCDVLADEAALSAAAMAEGKTMVG